LTHIKRGQIQVRSHAVGGKISDWVRPTGVHAITQQSPGGSDCIRAGSRFAIGLVPVAGEIAPPKACYGPNSCLLR